MMGVVDRIGVEEFVGSGDAVAPARLPPPPDCDVHLSGADVHTTLTIPKKTRMVTMRRTEGYARGRTIIPSIVTARKAGTAVARKEKGGHLPTLPGAACPHPRKQSSPKGKEKPDNRSRTTRPRYR